MAPEILESATPRYTKNVDIYSLALILYQIYTGGLHPFPGCHTLPKLIEAKLAGREPMFTPGFPQNLRPLVKRGYSRDPYRRPTLQEFKNGLNPRPSVFEKRATPVKPVPNVGREVDRFQLAGGVKKGPAYQVSTSNVIK